MACAELWRDAGEVLVSPFGTVPTLGARLARLTFSPDIVLTDGEAALMVGAPAVADRPRDTGARGGHAVPHRLRRGVVGSAPRDDDGQPDRPHRQPEPLGHRRLGAAQGTAGRGARRPRQLGQPPDQLLGPRPLAAVVRRAGRRGQRRRLPAGGGGRPRGHPLPRRAGRRLEPRRLRLRDPRPGHAHPLAAPRRERGRRRRGDRLRAGGGRRRGRAAVSPPTRSWTCCAGCSTPAPPATAR